MKTLARIISLLAGIVAMIAFLPLFGWMYWLIIPLAVIGLIFAYLGNSRGSKIVSIIVIIIGFIRLSMGGGIF